VNAALMKAQARSLLNWNRRAWILLGLSSSLVAIAIAGGEGPRATNVVYLCWVIGAGAISSDVSGGRLELIFVRPVTAREYVFSRWITISIAASLVHTAIALLAFTSAIATGLSRSASTLARESVAGAIVALGASGVLVLVSSVTRGLGDVALLALLQFAGTALAQVSEVMHSPALRSAASIVVDLLKLGSRLVNGSSRPVAVVEYTVILGICVSLAVVRVSTMQFSYARQE
jgi:hypothetical protein